MDLVVDGLIYEQQARGGISRIFSQVLPAMCALDANLRVELRSLDKFRLQDLPTHARIRPATIPQARPARVMSAIAPVVQEQLRAGWPRRAVFHSTYYTFPPVWRGPRVVSAYDTIHVRYAADWSHPADEAFRRRQRRAVGAAEAVVCISETTRQDLVERCGADPDRLHVVHLSHDPVFRPGQDRRGGEPPFVLYVGGRAASYKGFDTLLDAYARWPLAPDIGLTVVGAPWNDEEREALARLGPSHRVRLVSDIDDEALADLYRSAAAFVYPSRYEGFGIPLLEAMACRCPLVASRIPTTEEVAGDVPHYFGPGDADGLSDALTKAVEGGRASPNVARGEVRAQTFSWERAAAETLAVYRSL